MKINSLGSAQNFNGIKISKTMPKEIVKAIKENPVIQKAGKNYSLWFNHYKDGGTSLLMTSPKTDSALGLMLTPPHSIKRDSYYLGKNTHGVIEKLEEIEGMPYFFVERLGTPRTLKQRVRALLESIKIANMPENTTVRQEVELHKILTKYSNMNMVM